MFVIKLTKCYDSTLPVCGFKLKTALWWVNPKWKLVNSQEQTGEVEIQAIICSLEDRNVAPKKLLGWAIKPSDFSSSWQMPKMIPHKYHYTHWI